ncbi:hypothetical protein PYW07_002163 [Mythimna separata]|uniref:Lipase domain-containing protein n=1 Tax=Mythimna separata TaxID=271217 RepID=A0AAD8DT16_MYTSE|nr:hypothetical protein PYW07_002163 [Mythimna separata]
MLKLAIIFAAFSVCYGQHDNRYFLYTAPNDAKALAIDLTTIPTALPTDLVPSKEVIILIHGYDEEYKSPFNLRVSEELLKKNIPNIIALDWSVRAGNSYPLASRQVTEVAKQLTKFIDWLTDIPATGDKLIDVKEIHLVGFNLGAHVAGMASRNAKNRVGRITGLDPSGSGWGSRSGRLDKTDADYVEVIHTDGSGLLANGIGTNIGDVDIFVNGGSNQPGCFSHSCSHNRAWELFADSIDSTRALAYECRTMTQMKLNNCGTAYIPFGGTLLKKTPNGMIYRTNTGRRHPFFS